jgi:hypothetical protein
MRQDTPHPLSNEGVGRAKILVALGTTRGFRSFVQLRPGNSPLLRGLRDKSMIDMTRVLVVYTTYR